MTIASAPPTVLRLDGESLPVGLVARLARTVAPGVALSGGAVGRMTASVELRDELVAREIPIYGVTTGFGDSCTRQVAPDRAHQLQRSLVLYHLNGVGPVAPAPVARAAMLIRANTLARGVSGIRPEVVSTLLACLSRDILPLIPERGSVGASGDLVPLCYLAAAMMGESDVLHRGVRKPATSLRSAGIEPVTLQAKEGLALVNGTSYTTAYAVLAAWDAREIVMATELATAMTLEALHGNVSAFDPFVHRNKPHPGQVGAAADISALVRGTGLTTRLDEILARRTPLAGQGVVRQAERVQDRYSIRCAPQVIGIVRDTLAWVDQWLTVEINSATDNPLFDADLGELHLGGNFYAGHVGHAMDSLTTAVAGLANLIDRQLALVVDEKTNGGLPPNLVMPREPGDPAAGMHHGFKGIQIASSAVTAEAQKRTGPASVFSRSTEAHNQDVVSMGPIAARDAYAVCGLVREVTAMHLLALAQAIELRGVAAASRVGRAVHALIRERCPFVEHDRALDADIAAVVELIETGGLRRAVGISDDDFVAGSDFADVLAPNFRGENQ